MTDGEVLECFDYYQRNYHRVPTAVEIMGWRDLVRSGECVAKQE